MRMWRNLNSDKLNALLKNYVSEVHYHFPLSSQIRRRHREFKIGIRIRLVFQHEVPPFAEYRFKAVPHHHTLQKHSVLILRLGDAAAVGM